jgi:hypothetical protein
MQIEVVTCIILNLIKVDLVHHLKQTDEIVKLFAMEINGFD